MVVPAVQLALKLIQCCSPMILEKYVDIGQALPLILPMLGLSITVREPQFLVKTKHPLNMFAVYPMVLNQSLGRYGFNVKKIGILFIAFVLNFEITLANDSQDTIHIWENLKPTKDFGSQPILPEGWRVELFESAVFYQNFVFYQIYDSNKQIKVLRYDFNLKQGKIVDWNQGRIFGWTTYSDQLVLLTKSKIIFVDPIQFIVQKELPIKPTNSHWSNILVSNQKLVLFRGKKVSKIDLETGERFEEKELAFDSVQRVISWAEGNFALISTYWGNKIKIIHPESFALIKEISFPANHGSLFKMQMLNDESIIIADPLTKVFFEYTKFGESYFPISNQTQVAKNELAIRFSPIENNFEYNFRVEAKEDVDASTIHFLLPKKSTYSQEVSEEEFSKSTEVEYDRFENRILKLEVPSLKSGEIFQQTPYKAKMLRYKIHFNLDKLKLDYPNMTVPESITQYREDFSQLNFNDLRVINKRNEILENVQSLRETLNRVQKYVASIPYKSGKFESAPKVIEKNNGACTEHSYVTMALLRSLGIPSRLVWNYLPTESAPSFDFNHKFVEVWLPNYGWIPMEPLSPPISVAGTTYARHVIFATMRKVELAAISGGDRLFQFSKKDLNKSKKVKMNFKILKTNLTLPENEEADLSEIKIQTRSITVQENVTVP